MNVKSLDQLKDKYYGESEEAAVGIESDGR